MTPPEQSPAPQPQTTLAPVFSPGARMLLTLAASVVVLGGVMFAQELIGPLLLGAVIVIICLPVRAPLVRRGWPSWAATTMVILLGYLILAALAAMLWFAGARFIDMVMDLGPELQATAQGLFDQLDSWGLEQSAADTVAGLLSPSTLLGYGASIGSSALNVLMALFFVLAYVIFMAADAGRYTTAESAFGERIRPTVARFQVYNTGVRRYYVVNATFGAIVAVVDGLALWVLSVPAPMVWAILAFVTNFIPNIGFVLGVIPPALLALVVGGWPLMLAVIAVYCVVNVTLQVLIQPKFVSDAVNLSLTLSFFSVIFWTFIIGPLGAILSIPLTLLVRALILDGDPGAAWLRWLSGDDNGATEGRTTATEGRSETTTGGASAPETELTAEEPSR
ncbi:AI-2E family transporter [Serinibacter salmoneus]|uniref:Putative PurR-regulated permease PerM n=1 Tax=Serinibacter salmoneus TaxID=556530 RepID=A0A2A9CW01_9MICO|nr:AI-2E family transporter [Serinibacter salmoneus]PFG18598.1 putative PurR-regulated permease PerM [Serinibacter salmoneus]